MDFLSVIGVIVAFTAILGGNWLEGGHLDALVNGPALVIVLGGTIGAIMLHTPVPVFMRSMRMLLTIFFPPKYKLGATVSKLVDWSVIARKDGLLGLERLLASEKDLFLRKGMELLVDGNDPDDIRDVLEVQLESKEKLELQAAKVYESMGAYSPTIGIIGAVLGLIHVMQNLADPSKLGSGIATAFVATIYGVALANLFLIPIANKLKAYVQEESHYRDLVIMGIIGISEGDNPRSLEIKLKGFIH